MFEMDNLSSHTASAAFFRAVTILVGLGFLFCLCQTEPSQSWNFAALAFLSLVAFACETSPVELPRYGVVSGLESTILAALFVGPFEGAVVILAAGLLSRARRRGAAYRWDYSLYSFFQTLLAFGVPFTALKIAGHSHPLAFAVAAISACLIDQAFVACHLYLLQGRLGSPVTRMEWGRVKLSATVFLPLGILLGACIQLGAVATVLLLFPLAVASYRIKNYVDTLREAREVVTSLVEAVEKREEGSEGHSERVASLAASIARELGVKERIVRRIVTAGRLHDLGKIGIDESVLNKRTELTSEDLVSLRRHPEVGAKVAAHLSLGKEEAQFIYHHHENFDGTGYPHGLAGHDIPQGARILAVAEAYDCMVSNDRQSARMTPKLALLELELGQGLQFDPKVVAAFRSVLQKRIA